MVLISGKIDRDFSKKTDTISLFRNLSLESLERERARSTQRQRETRKIY